MTKRVTHDNDPFAAPRFVTAGQQLKQLMELPKLPWPRNLFAQQPLTIEELMAEHGSFVPHAGPLRENLCACGCNMPHNNGYAKTITSEAGGRKVHRVLWFRTFGHYTQAQRRTGL